MTSRFGGDDDLNDLIGSGGGENGETRSQMKPLNLDHLAEGELDVPVKRSRGGAGNDCSLLKLLCAYIAYTCDYAPRTCWAIGVAALLVPTYFLMMAVFFNPTEHFGIVNDYTDITSQYDLTIGKIDHWCLKGDNDSCRCEDPLDPQSRGEFRTWTKAQVANTDLVQSLIDQGLTTPDIAFLGTSVIEEMNGSWFGNDADANLKYLKAMFNKNFKKSEGSDVEAVALGIAGDTSPTVLWRLMNGEMPPAFNPKIWWLEVGLNDLGRSQCSEEVVVLGVLRVVEEILSKKPDAIVVINSLFPLADLRGGVRPGDSDFKDSFDKNLRQKPTDRINKPNRQNKPNRPNRPNGRPGRNGNGNGGNTDNGDSTVVKGHVEESPDKRGKNKRGENKRPNKDGQNKRQKNGERAERNGRNGGGRLLEVALSTPGRRLLFGRNGKKEKEVKMQAHKETQKKFNPVTRHERKLPLWTSVSAINAQLKKFASKHDKVYFFDATDIFTEREDSNTYILKTDMISIRGHPSKRGYEKWEEAVKVKAKAILAGQA